MRRTSLGTLLAGLGFGFASQFLSTAAAQSGTLEARPDDVAGRAGVAQPGQTGPVDPQLLAILHEWERKTGQIQKLEGRHRRYVYDSIFEVETRGDGIFYYEAPDKGRIELEGSKIPKDTQSERLGAKGKPYELRAELDDIWICDGTHLAQAMVQQKVYAMHQIPPEDRGRNIMDSPLPFLFGLPVQKALQRYDMTVNPQTNERMVWLDIKPLRPVDMAQWKSAQVILDRNTFLPVAVKMIDRTGNRETVYAFTELKANQRRGVIEDIWKGSPFDIERALRGYKEIVQNDAAPPAKAGNAPPMNDPRNVAANPGTAANRNIPASGVKLQMPNCSNFDYASVKKIFEEKGFEVEFRRAGPARTPDEVFKVAKQDPPAGTELQQGQKVTFYLFEKIETATP